MQLVWSGAKGCTAVCMALLLERGLIELNAPVAGYWPEFGAAGKEGVLVREVVSHTVGLPGIDVALTWQEGLDDRRMAALLAAQSQSEDPRARSTYHGLTYGWLCGELVRRVDGRSIGRFFAEEVAEPLQLELWLGLPAEQEPRVTRIEQDSTWTGATPEQLEADPLLQSLHNPPFFDALTAPWNESAWHAAEIPAANAIGTARSIAMLYGKLDTILSPETLELVRRPLSTRVDGLIGVPMSFGVGFGLQTEALSYGPPPEAFGHGGAGGSWHGRWPKQHVGFSYAMNLMRGAGDVRGQSLLGALYDALPVR